MQFAIIINYDASGGDFDNIRKNYKLELYFIVIICSLCSMYILYFMIKNMRNKNAVKLQENTPIFHWSYEKQYWERIKTIELKKEALRYLVKLSLIWIPICFIVFFIGTQEQMVSIILGSVIFVFTIPIIPFTIGEFTRKINNQLFQEKYDVKILIRGLTINKMYYPYRRYGNEILILKDIEEINNIWIFKAEKSFYSRASDGGDSGQEIRRTVNISIPIPTNENISIDTIKAQLEIK